MCYVNQMRELFVGNRDLDTGKIHIRRWVQSAAYGFIHFYNYLRSWPSIA